MATAATRNKEIATIKIAVKQLGLDDGTYRDMLFAVARVRSAADLDWSGRKRVIDHLKASGAKIGRPGKPKKMDSELMHKIQAQLTDMKLPWEYAQSMARHMFKVARLEWCNQEQQHKIVAALEYEAMKRSLLDQVDVMLKIAGKTRADITARTKTGKDWTRNIAALKQAIAFMQLWWPESFLGWPRENRQ